MMEKELNAFVRLAEFEARSAEETRSRLQEEHHAASRWMIASLFAVNAGSIAAILGNSRFDPLHFLPTIFVYFCGVVGAFAMALFGQLSDRAMIAAMHSWGLYWIRVSITEVRDPEDEQRIRHQIDRAELTGRNGRIAGLSSMGAFLIATMAAILAIYVTQSAK